MLDYVNEQKQRKSGQFAWVEDKFGVTWQMNIE